MESKVAKRLSDHKSNILQKPHVWQELLILSGPPQPTLARANTQKLVDDAKNLAVVQGSPRSDDAKGEDGTTVDNPITEVFAAEKTTPKQLSELHDLLRTLLHPLDRARSACLVKEAWEGREERREPRSNITGAAPSWASRLHADGTEMAGWTGSLCGRALMVLCFFFAPSAEESVDKPARRRGRKRQKWRCCAGPFGPAER